MATARVLFPNRFPVTAGLRFRFTGPVETGWIQIQIQINSNFPVQPVPTGLPVGLTGLPAGFTGLPVGLTGNRSNSIFFSLNSNARKVY